MSIKSGIGAELSRPVLRGERAHKLPDLLDLFHKGEHEQQFAYVTGVACERHNFVLGFNIAPGNTHNSIMFDELYDDVTARFTEAKAVAVDAGYKTPAIMKKILDSERIPCVPYKRPMTKEGFFKKYEYVYDEYYDCILCPQNHVLKYSTTNREGYREYKSDPSICRDCPNRMQCTYSKTCQKVVTRHIWEPYMEQAEEYRLTPEYKAIYDLRKETIERVFGDTEEKYGIHYTQLRALLKVKMQGALTFACMNLKKTANWKYKNGLPSSIFLSFFRFYLDFSKKVLTLRRKHLFVYGLKRTLTSVRFIFLTSFDDLVARGAHT